MKTMIAITVGALFFLNSVVVSGAESLKIRHIGSVYADSKGVGLVRPEGVACNDSSTFVVADTGNGRLIRYTVREGTVQRGELLAVSELSNPLVIHISAQGDLLVLDGKQRKIARVGSDGAFKGFVTPVGIPSPQEYIIRNFKAAGGELYLLDIYSGRVLVLDDGGRYVRHIPVPPGQGALSDLAVDAKGTVFLLDSVNGRLYAAPKEAKGFSPFGPKLEEYMNFPASMAVDARGILYLVDQNGSSVVAIGTDGSFQGRALGLGWKEGLLNHPEQICINGKGEVFIADSGNNRVQVFTIVE